MAEGVLFEVAARIIGQSGKLALQIGELWGLKDELEKLQKTVSAIKAVLLDAEENQVQSHAIKDWVENLKDALYEADDVLDNFSTESLRREQMTQNKKAKKVRIFFSKSNQLAYGFKMGHNIKAMREKLDAINANRMEFHLVERVVETQVRTVVRADDAIGREDDKKAIIERLLDSNIEENVSILPIVGIGGLGKTTLAQLVFNHEEIQKHFEKKLWVCISGDFDEKIIVEKILECAKGKKQEENLAMNTLVNDLHKEIDGKRYLLVLDDVWEHDRVKWLSLENLLKVGARGSRILVTTRVMRVAKTVQTVEPHVLRCLNEDQSWSLFKQMAFENGQEPENLRIREIGKEIVGRCKGIPLAIKIIGSILYLKKTEEDWLSFKNNEFSNVDQKENDILLTLRLSYDHLPSHLKQCFAYCSLFPRDYMFNRETLIQQWMAQGFIKLSNENECLKHVGSEYFTDLLCGSFFQEVEEDEWGNKNFKIHDLMHDLAISVARLENTCVINGESVPKTTHHVSFGFHLSSSSQIPNSLYKACRIRTFLLPNQPSGLSRQMVWEQSTCDAFVSTFKFLRLLDLNNTGISSVPCSIGKLKHLRYLDLSYNDGIEMLPNFITRLLNLQTLKLTACARLKKLPRDINKLVNLMYLEISGCMLLTPTTHGLEQLTNCHIVQQSMVGKDLTVDLLIELRNGEDAALESKAANLKEKQHLQALRLRWIENEVDEGDVFYDEKLDALQPHQNLEVLSLYRYWGVKFPGWLSSLKNLVEFVLFGCKKCQHLPPLDHFPSLKVLELDSLLALEYISEEKFSNSSFLPPLEKLKLKYCPKLKGWWQMMTENHLLPSFPHLSKLCIRGCLNLTSVPLFPYLRNLELYYCSLKPLEQTTQMAAVATIASTSSSSTLANSSFAPLSRLASLEIGQMKEPLPEECLQNLVSLDHLLIYECRGPLLQGIRHLTALKKLDICSSKVFDLPNDGNGMEWQCLRSLSSLCLFQLLELESFPVGLQYVTSLRNLMLDYCPNLDVIPEWIYNLTSLQSLEISQCPKLKSLPIGICGLTSLQTLKILKCFNFTSFPENMGGLASLQTLYISECPKLTSLPEGIRCLTSLHKLDISMWLNLTSLPEWIGGVASLKALYISECPNLTSLPEGLISLETLCIQDCPILLERCKKTGTDWPKIAHIPNLLRDRQGTNLLVEESNEAPMKADLKCWSLIKTFGCCNCSESQQLTD